MIIRCSLLCIFLSTLIVVLCLFSASLHAEEQSTPVPAGLDFETRHAKVYRFELEPFGGEYLGDDLNNSWIAGVRFGYRFNKNITLGATFGYSHINYDPNSSFGVIAHNKNEYISNGFVSFAVPMLQRTGKKISELDLFTSLGMGNLRINASNNMMGLIGGGIRMYFKPARVALRIDVNTYMYELPTSTGNSFNDDWTFTVGPSFFFF